jgi:hypothetical protein
MSEFTQEDIDNAVSAAVEQVKADLQEEYGGLSSKNDELIKKLKDAKSGLKKWEGLDADNVRKVMEHFESDQDLKDIAAGKHDEVISRRIQKAEAEYNAKIESLTSERDKYNDDLGKANAKIKDLLIDNTVVSAFVNEKGIDSAIPDVVARAKSLFTIQDGEAVAFDGDGKILTGKDGALTIGEWVGSLKETAPHLFPQSRGGGAGGSTQQGKSTNIDEKLQAAISSGDMAEYRKLRKAQDNS